MPQIRENDELRVRAMEMAVDTYKGQGLPAEEVVRAAHVIYTYLVKGIDDERE